MSKSDNSTVASAGLISICTMASRILGFARDVLAASVLGAGAMMDAFVLAYTIPNLFRRLFGEGAMRAAFVPVFSEYDADAEKDERKLVSVAFTWLALILSGIMLLLWIAAMIGIPLLRDSEKWRTFFILLTIMSPHLPLICLVALLSGALQARRNFIIPEIGPVLLNIFWIGGIVVGYRVMGMSGVAVGILLGGAAELALHLEAVRRKGLLPRIDRDFSHPGLKRVKHLLAPVVIGLAAMQINTLFDRLIAEFFVPGDGANSALFYGSRLMNLPLGVLALPIATAVFPALARHAASGDRESLNADLSQATRLVLFVTIPCIAVTLVAAVPIVRLVYERGSFAAEPDATARAAAVLQFYILGLWAYGAVHVLSRAFYSLQDTKTPVRIALVVTGVNLVLNLILVFPMREAGLALSTAVCSMLNFGWLALKLRGRLGVGRGTGVMHSTIRTIIAGAFCLVACYVTLALTGGMMGVGTIGKAFDVFAPMAAGLIVFGSAAALMRMGEIGEITSVMRRRKG